MASHSSVVTLESPTTRNPYILSPIQGGGGQHQLRQKLKPTFSYLYAKLWLNRPVDFLAFPSTCKKAWKGREWIGLRNTCPSDAEQLSVTGRLSAPNTRWRTFPLLILCSHQTRGMSWRYLWSNTEPVCTHNADGSVFATRKDYPSFVEKLDVMTAVMNPLLRGTELNGSLTEWMSALLQESSNSDETFCTLKVQSTP